MWEKNRVVKIGQPYQNWMKILNLSLCVKKKGPLDGTPEKLVVEVYILSFRPVGTQKLQTARRGKPFTPRNLSGWVGARSMCRGDKI